MSLIVTKLEEARKFCSMGQLGKAETVCLEEIAELHEILGYIYQQTGRHEQAIESCKTSILLQPSISGNYLTLCRSYRSKEEYDLAFSAIKKGFNLLPDSADHCINYLELTEKIYGIDAAVALYSDQFNKNMQEDPQIKKLYIELLFETGQFKEKIQAIDQHQNEYREYKIVSVTEWVQEKKIPFLSVGTINEIPISSPPVFNASGYSPASHTLTTHSVSPYVIELSNATIFSGSSIILTGDNTVFNDSATHPQFGADVSFQHDKTVIARKNNRILMNHAQYELEHIEKGIYLSGSVTDAFGHWVPEYLGKLLFYEKHPEFSRLPIIVDASMPTSHFDYLKCLVPNKLIRMPQNMSYSVSRLLVAPTPTFYPVHLIKDHKVSHKDTGPLSPQVLSYLKNKVLKNISSKKRFGPKLYLSRRHMKWRRLLNDTEIAAILSRKGFEIVFVEELSFAEQVDMFMYAESIVAPNGSSLLNTIFANTNVKIYMLSQPDLFNWGGFYGPMQSIGYKNILAVTGDTILKEKQVDYVVPVERLQQAMAYWDNK